MTRVLLTVPLEASLVRRIAAVAPDVVRVTSLTPLRTPRDGFPSTREAACVSEDALEALREARIVVGAWTRPLQALVAANGLGDRGNPGYVGVRRDVEQIVLAAQPPQQAIEQGEALGVAVQDRHPGQFDEPGRDIEGAGYFFK